MGFLLTYSPAFLFLIILIIEIIFVRGYSTVLTLLMLYAILTFNNFIFEQACKSAYFCWHLSQKSNVLLYKNLHKHCSLIYCPYVMFKTQYNCMRVFRRKQFAALQLKGLYLNSFIQIHLNLVKRLLKVTNFPLISLCSYQLLSSYSF